MNRAARRHLARRGTNEQHVADLRNDLLRAQKLHAAIRARNDEREKELKSYLYEALEANVITLDDIDPYFQDPS